MKKIRLNKNGASLAETLVTVLLLVIVLSAVTTGVHAMTTSYYQIRRKANAESLLMTASDVIRGDLRNSTAVQNDDGNGGLSLDDQRFYCQSRYSIISYANGDAVTGGKKEDGIQVLYYDEDTGETTHKPLVTNATNTKGLYTYIPEGGNFKYSNGYIKGTIQIIDSNGKVQEKTELDVRPFRFGANNIVSDSETGE